VILRVLFPRIEISGLDRLPAAGSVVLAVNHPNGLIDPLFLLCLSPRPVSFLAKAPLFEMPVIGWFVRALGSIPVYRRQDGGFDSARNRETFERARAILSGGGVIAIFPEGASHGDPRLRPLKTGAARIALGATSIHEGERSLVIAPVGIYYTAKGIFRSSALLYFGDPIQVAPSPLKADGEPPADAVRALTDRIEGALSAVTLQADEHEALALVSRAEEVFSSEDPAAEDRLVDRFELRQRFMAGYTALRTKSPERLAAISTRIDRYEAELQEAGLDRGTLRPREAPSDRGLTAILKTLVFLVTVMPIALVGTVINYPTYRLVGLITARLSRDDDDIVATIKMIAGALLFPLAWILIAIVIGTWLGWQVAIVALVVAPLTGYAALFFFERLDRSIGGLRAIMISRFSRWGFLKLVAERRAIHEEIVQLASEFEG